MEAFCRQEKVAEIENKYPLINDQNITPIRIMTTGSGQDVIIAGTSDGQIYAMDRNGKPKWHSKIAKNISSNFAVAKSFLIASGKDGIYKLDLSSSKIIKYPEINDIIEIQPIMDEENDCFYTASSSGNVYKLSLSEQKKIWQKFIQGAGLLPLMLNESKDILIIPTTDGNIFSLKTDGSDTDKETIIWQSKGNISIPPIIYKNKLLISTNEKKLYGFDLRTGQEYANLDLEGNPKFPPSIFNGYLLIGTDDNRFSAFNMRESKQEWSRDFVLDSPSYITDKAVYFGTDDGKLYALGWILGNNLWQLQLDSPINSGINVDSGIIFFTSRFGILYAIDESDGSILWRYPIYGQSITQPQVKDGRIFVLSNNANVYIFSMNDVIRFRDFEKTLEESVPREKLTGYMDNLSKTNDSAIAWQNLYQASSIATNLEDDLYDIKLKIWSFLNSDWSKFSKIGFRFKTSKGVFTIYANEDSKSQLIGDIKLICLMNLLFGDNYVDQDKKANLVEKIKTYGYEQDINVIRQDIYDAFANANVIFGGSDKAIQYFNECRDFARNERFPEAFDKFRLAMSERDRKMLEYTNLLGVLSNGKNDDFENRLNIDISHAINKDKRTLLFLIRSDWVLQNYANANSLFDKEDTQWNDMLKSNETYLDNSEIYCYLGMKSDRGNAKLYYQKSIDLGKNELSNYYLGDIYFIDCIKLQSPKDDLPNGPFTFHGGK